MLKTKRLTADGTSRFLSWLESRTGSEPPADLISGEAFSEPFGDYDIDPDRVFVTRQEFGEYLNEQLAGADFSGLMSSDSDGLWIWIAVVYFKQLAAIGVRRPWHYVVTRKGSVGSLAYRHAVRTSYELVHIHGSYAEICLKSPIHTLGDMTEQLASRQTVAHNRGFFQTAHELYIKDGKLKRGASTKPKKPRERKPGDRTGLGSVRRLAIALQRLDLTYDTEAMQSAQMKSVLPKEFSKWASPSP